LDTEDAAGAASDDGAAVLQLLTVEQLFEAARQHRLGHPPPLLQQYGCAAALYVFAFTCHLAMESLQLIGH
jgi:hypothetical protein